MLHNVTCATVSWSKKSEAHFGSGEGTQTLLFDGKNVDGFAALKKTNATTVLMYQKTHKDIPADSPHVVALKRKFQSLPLNQP